jgi:hypothetical protein
LILFLLLCPAALCEAAAAASGRNWRIAIVATQCEAAQSLVSVGARVHFLGPQGAVEAPVIRLVDAAGKALAPKSVAWNAGSKALAQWLSAGGLRNIASGDLGEIQLKFDLRGATGPLRLEFGDAPAFAISRGNAPLCENVLKPDEIRAPRLPRSAAKEKIDLPIYRERYPCRDGQASRTVAAEYPPYVPKQLVVLGRGFLPNVRDIRLPMGTAPAQPYAYAGPHSQSAVEAAAKRAIAADFPAYAPAKHFAFNWGEQKAESGNDIYSIGVYELRPCPK